MKLCLFLDKTEIYFKDVSEMSFGPSIALKRKSLIQRHDENSKSF